MIKLYILAWFQTQISSSIQEIHCGQTINGDSSESYTIYAYNDSYVNVDACASDNLYNIELTVSDSRGGEETNIANCYPYDPFSSEYSRPYYLDMLSFVQKKGQIRNITVWTLGSSYQLNVTCHPIPIIECNQSLSGHLDSSQDIDYIYFNLTSETNYLLFDSCLSSYDTYLYFMDSDFNVLYEGDDDGDCASKEQLLVQSLTNAGIYILKISGSPKYPNNHYDTYHEYGNWHISISCSKSNESSESETPIMQCNETASGHLESSPDYIHFNLTSATKYILFDSRPSKIDTRLYLFDINETLLYRGGLYSYDYPWRDEQQLAITDILQPGFYTMKIYSDSVGYW